MAMSTTTAGGRRCWAAPRWSPSPSPPSPEREPRAPTARTPDHRLTPRTQFTMAAGRVERDQGRGRGHPQHRLGQEDDLHLLRRPHRAAAWRTPPTRPTSARWTRSSRRSAASCPACCADARRHHQKPAIVFDADDTTLWTYQMEVGDMKFVFTPAAQAPWVDGERFPATPGMVDFVNDAQAIGYTVFGLTGRSDGQKAARSATWPRSATPPSRPTDYFTK